MNLYIMQHGPCLPAEVNPDQPLSPVGRDQMAASARAMRVMGLWFDAMACSPRTAAVQAARLIAEGMGYSAGAVGQLPALDAATSLKSCLEGLRPLERHQAVMLVGHLPLLGDLASHLLSTGPRLSLSLENGALLCLSVQSLAARGGTLRWLLQPPQMQMIAAS